MVGQRSHCRNGNDWYRSFYVAWLLQNKELRSHTTRAREKRARKAKRMGFAERGQQRHAILLLDQVQANNDQENACFGEQEGRQGWTGKKDRDPTNQGFFTTINLLNNYGYFHVCTAVDCIRVCCIAVRFLIVNVCCIPVHVCCIVKDATNMNRYFHVVASCIAGHHKMRSLTIRWPPRWRRWARECSRLVHGHEEMVAYHQTSKRETSIRKTYMPTHRDGASGYSRAIALTPIGHSWVRQWAHYEHRRANRQARSMGEISYANLHERNLIPICSRTRSYIIKNSTHLA